MNNVVLIGNLTRDPETRAFDGDSSMCKFSVAVRRDFSNKDGEREADFFDVVAWRGLGENVSRYCRKGSKVGVRGRLRNRSYTDKDGNRRTAIEIVADDVEFLDSRSASSNTGDGDNGDRGERRSRSYKPTSAPLDVNADDLPF